MLPLYACLTIDDFCRLLINFETVWASSCHSDGISAKHFLKKKVLNIKHAQFFSMQRKIEIPLIVVDQCFSSDRVNMYVF